MRLHPYIPRPPLSHDVRLMWFVRGTPDYLREKVLPNGLVELIFNLGSPHKVVDPEDSSRFDLYRDSWVSGMHEGFIVIEAVREFDLVGVQLYPHGARRLLGLPMTELTNRVIEGDLLGSPEIRGLREHLGEAPTPRLKLSVLERFLQRRLAVAEEVDPWLVPVLERLHRVDRPASVGELSRAVGLSHKHLIHRFKAQIGVTPKRLQRILRLQAAIRRAAEPQVDWAAVAVECGFYDQPHLIREFRSLTGVTPATYLAKRDADPNHLIVA